MMWNNTVSCYRKINPTPTETNRFLTNKPVVNPGMFYVLCSYANKIISKYKIIMYKTFNEMSCLCLWCYFLSFSTFQIFCCDYSYALCSML